MADSTAIIATVSTRLRDAANTAFPTALLNRILDQCQRILNVNQRILLNTTTFVTAPGRSLYQITAIASDIARVEMVRQDGRNLFDIPWESLMHQDKRWMRQQGNRAEYFSRIGNDILVIAPALPFAVTLNVVYTSVPATPTGVPGDVTIPDEYIPLLQDMMEATALLRSRRFTEMKAPMERIRATLTTMGDESIEIQGGPR